MKKGKHTERLLLPRVFSMRYNQLTNNHFGSILMRSEKCKLGKNSIHSVNLLTS